MWREAKAERAARTYACLEKREVISAQESAMAFDNTQSALLPNDNTARLRLAACNCELHYTDLVSLKAFTRDNDESHYNDESHLRPIHRFRYSCGQIYRSNPAPPLTFARNRYSSNTRGTIIGTRHYHCKQLLRHWIAGAACGPVKALIKA